MATVITTGNIVADAEVRSVNDTTDALNFTVADNETYPKGNGEVAEYTEYVDCVIYGKKGSLNGLASGLILKGQPMAVEGKLRRKVKRDDAGAYAGESTRVVVKRENIKPVGSNPSKNAAA